MPNDAEDIIVQDVVELLKIVKERGGGEFSARPEVEAKKMREEEAFICHFDCSDGSRIDFWAHSADELAKIPAVIRGDYTDILQKFIRDFVTLVADDNPFVSVIKGQAYIESLLTTLLEGTLIPSKKLKIERWTISRKLEWCNALGLIHSDVMPTFEKFAEYRNIFAHQIWPEFTEGNVKDLCATLHKCDRLKSIILSKDKNSLGVFECVWAMWMYLFEQVLRVKCSQSSLSEFRRGVIDSAEEIGGRMIIKTKPIDSSQVE